MYSLEAYSCASKYSFARTVNRLNHVYLKKDLHIVNFDSTYINDDSIWSSNNKDCLVLMRICFYAFNLVCLSLCPLPLWKCSPKSFISVRRNGPPTEYRESKVCFASSSMAIIQTKIKRGFVNYSERDFSAIVNSRDSLGPLCSMIIFEGVAWLGLS